jgi:hypothetical protein
MGDFPPLVVNSHSMMDFLVSFRDLPPAGELAPATFGIAKITLPAGMNGGFAAT